MIDPKFKDVKIGDWIFTISFGWIKVTTSRDPQEYIYIIFVRTVSYTVEGFRNTGDKHPSAWTYNPFDPDDRPPCEFKKGEVLMTRDSKDDSWFPRILYKYNADNEYPYLCKTGGVGYKLARKLSSTEKGE